MYGISYVIDLGMHFQISFAVDTTVYVIYYDIAYGICYVIEKV